VFSDSASDCPKTAGKILGTAGRRESQPIVAETGEEKGSTSAVAEVYAWFTEGFDTADLQEAKALLEALA